MTERAVRGEVGWAMSSDTFREARQQTCDQARRGAWMVGGVHVSHRDRLGVCPPADVCKLLDHYDLRDTDERYPCRDCRS
jgi:hypothetical protein